MMRVKIRSFQVIKLILTGFVVVQENMEALGLNAQTSQAQSVLLRHWTLYFPVQHRTGWYAHIIEDYDSSKKYLATEGCFI